MTKLGRRISVCTRCGRSRYHLAKGMCRVCYYNSRRSYRPTGNPGGRGVPKDSLTVAGRIADYAEIRRRGYTVEKAAERLGVNGRTGWRYEARLRQQAQQGAA